MHAIIAADVVCLTCVHVQAWECANKLGLIGPAMEQPQYNMFEREKVCTASGPPPPPISGSAPPRLRDNYLCRLVVAI